MGCHRLANLLSVRLRSHEPSIIKEGDRSNRPKRECICPYRKVSHKRRNHTNYVNTLAEMTAHMLMDGLKGLE